MADDQIDRVAGLLATIGGAWYPERTRTALRVVGDRHREVARLALESLGRPTDAAAGEQSATSRAASGTSFNFAKDDQLHVGATVIYRPPGEKRAVTCRVEKMDRGRAYLVPALQEIGWVPMRTLQPLPDGTEP